MCEQGWYDGAILTSLVENEILVGVDKNCNIYGPEVTQLVKEGRAHVANKVVERLRLNTDAEKEFFVNNLKGNHWIVLEYNKKYGLVTVYDALSPHTAPIDGPLKREIMTIVEKLKLDKKDECSIKRAWKAVSYTHLTLPTTPYV